MIRECCGKEIEAEGEGETAWRDIGSNASGNL